MAGLMGLDWKRQRELLKLRGKLSFRQFMGEKAKILTAVTTIMVLAPFSVGLAAATGAGYLLLPDQWPAQLLGFVLILSWLIWIAAPIFSFNVNEGLDPTRLLVYPISRRDFLAHMLLGTLLDYPTYFLAPFALAIIVGFGLGWTLPVVLIAIFLCYLLMVMTSQTIINTLGGVLKSRRFRDISMVVGAFIGIGCWLLSTSMQGFFGEFSDVNEQEAERFFQTWEPLNWMQWLPPGAAARAIDRASSGEWGASLLWLGYTLIWVVVIGWLWWQVTHRIVTGEGFLVGRAPTKEKEGKAAAKAKKTGGISWDWIPADIRQIALKDVKIRWRTPQSRIGLIYMFLMPAFFVAYPLFFAPDEIPPTFDISKYIFAGGVTLYTMFVFWTNGQNMLGWETTGLSILLTMPIPRQRIFLGKGLAQFMMNGIPLFIMIILAIVIQPGLVSLSLLPNSIAQGLAIMSVLVFTSVLFPYPINIESQSGPGQNPFAGQGGCLTGIVNISLVPMLIGLVSLPVIVPLGIALWLDWSWLALVGSFIALPYGAVLFWFATRTAGKIALEREPEILVATRIKDDRG